MADAPERLLLLDVLVRRAVATAEVVEVVETRALKADPDLQAESSELSERGSMKAEVCIKMEYAKALRWRDVGRTRGWCPPQRASMPWT